MLDLVYSYSDGIRNAKKFYSSINDESLIKKLSQFRHWYYIEVLDAFAPSKLLDIKRLLLMIIMRERNKHNLIWMAEIQ